MVGKKDPNLRNVLVPILIPGRWMSCSHWKFGLSDRVFKVTIDPKNKKCKLEFVSSRNPQMKAAVGIRRLSSLVVPLVTDS